MTRSLDTRLNLADKTKKFIAQDLGIKESALGRYMSLIRLGALPAFVIIPFADRLGRRAPILITHEMVAVMRWGSVIVDLAVEQGGNVEGSVPGEVV